MIKKIWIVNFCDKIDKQLFENPEISQLIYFFEKVLNIEIIFWDNLFCDIELTNPKKRAEDINKFYADDSIDMIWPLVGWAFGNEILPFLDYDLIKKNPKIVCWNSDITSFVNTIHKKTWQITFLGPDFLAFSKSRFWILETRERFKKMIFDKDYQLNLFDSNDFYYDNTSDVENWIINDWWLKVLKSWITEWKIVGWNLSTVILLLWTDFEIDFEDKILFLEECAEFSIGIIRRNLIQLKQNKNIHKLKWIVFWKVSKWAFKDYNISWENTLKDFSDWLNIPILYNAQFWHTSPNWTIPIGWKCKIDTKQKKCLIS